MKMQRVMIVLVLALSLMLSSTALAQETVPLNPSHIGAANPGFGLGSCPVPPAGQEGWWGWHFIMPANNNFTSLTVTFQNAGTFSADPFPGGVFVAHPDESHAYIWTPGPDVLLGGVATSSGTNEFFNLSHVCVGTMQEELTVTKTAVTSYTRTHDWAIEKSVDTDALYLYVDGSGDAEVEWTVDVSYLGYQDSDYAVSGVITIENTGMVDAVITSIDDVLAGMPIEVMCDVELPYTLAAGGSLTCSYSEAGYIEGTNEVTVVTERDMYGATADIVWGDPTSEVNASVDVKDISDLFGEVVLGTVSAPNDASFTYEKSFAWADYGQDLCGEYLYNNTAQIIGDGGAVLDEAYADLEVYVQCLIFKGDTAWAANGNVPGELRYTRRGNWATYVKYDGVEKTTTLFAGQTMNAGSVTFSAPVDGFVTISVQLSGDWVFAPVMSALKVQDYATAPSGNPAPGLFAWKVDAMGNSATITVPVNNFYGVHADVGRWIPDPNFGM